MMNWLINNWYIIIAFIAVAVSGGLFTYKFTKMPYDKQIEALKMWLLYAVTMAEKELGGGTGILKLRYVYDLFLAKFTWLAKIITFEQFSLYVDEALVSMKHLLETNESIANVVAKEDK